MSQQLSSLYFAVDWYTQVFNGVPIFLLPCSYSGFTMKKDLGFGYTDFLFTFKSDSGKMRYRHEDLKRIWELVHDRMNKDKNYLRDLRKDYHRNYEKLIAELHNEFGDNWEDFNSDRLLSLLQRLLMIQTETVGVAHILEALGIYLEEELKKELEQLSLPKNESNKLLALLSSPTEMSFVTRQEEELLRIAGLSKTKQAKALAQHAREYSWIQNSYLGHQNLDAAYFETLMTEVKKHPPKKIGAIDEKKRAIQQHNLSKTIQDLSHTIDFATVWQDERKERILRIIEKADSVIRMLTKQLNKSKKSLYYATPREIMGCKSTKELLTKITLTHKRKDGVVILQKEDTDIILTGENFQKTLRSLKSQSLRTEVQEDLHGSIANGGSAIGKVVVCNNADDIGKVTDGDIIVASMTRPEYMPALKKASAIVTDEGGITSHAAIVSRELGIPAVIGTKHATEVLKTGMIVEVRANHGFVKILEK